LASFRQAIDRSGRCDEPAVPIVAAHAPAVIAASRPRASYRFLEFFIANIRNRHTRRAHARAAREFFDWLAAKGITQFAAIESIHVAAYIEELQRARSAPTAKLRLHPQRSSCGRGRGPFSRERRGWRRDGLIGYQCRALYPSIQKVDGTVN
jgi:hypothetical protein